MTKINLLALDGEYFRSPKTQNMDSEIRGDNRSAARSKLYTKLWMCVLSALILTILCSVDGATMFAKRREKREEGIPECENNGNWNKQSQSCSCTLGWVGVYCNVWHNHHCYFDNGFGYRGKLSRTESGSLCQPWTTDNNLRFPLGKDGVGVHNHCRNPDNDEKGLWCYVEGEDFIGYCNATRCPDSMKNLLSMNNTEIATDDDTSPVVQFLFGPLISGVCVGVVFLLAFIAIAEYMRRRRFFAKRAKRQHQLELKVEKGEGQKVTNEDKEKPGKADPKETKSSNDEGRDEIRTLGGIITVDVDTGKEKCHNFTVKDLSQASRVALAANGIGQDNQAFLQNEPEESRRISVDTLELGPPPPYDQPDDVAIKESSDPNTSGLVHVNSVVAPISSQTENGRCNDVISRFNEESERAKRDDAGARAKRKKRNKRNVTSRASVESLNNVRVEEQLNETTQRPVPKQRTSIKARGREDRSDVTDVKETDRTQKPRSKQHRRERSRTRERPDTNQGRRSRSTSRRRSSERRRRRASRDSAERRESRHKDDVTREPRHESSTRNTYKKTRHRGDKLLQGDISQKRKSVKDMARVFEKNETHPGMEEKASKPTNNTKNISQKPSDKHNEALNVTKINSRSEPTTFL